MLKSILPALLGLAVSTTWLVAPDAIAATTSTTASCVDGGGRSWRTRVDWSDPYQTGDGTTKVHVNAAAWTTTGGSIGTDSIVRTYNSSGTLLAALSRTATVDYKQGTVWDVQNPLDPPTGGARITVSIGVDGDGKANCTTTHHQPTVASGVRTATSPPLMGASAADNVSFDALNQRSGPLATRRTFSGALPSSFARSAAAPDVLARRQSYWSFAPSPARFVSDTAAQAAFSAFLDTIPVGHRTVIVAWHEPEDNIRRGEFTLAQWGAMNTKVAQIIRSKRRPELRHGICLMGPWTFDSRSPYYRYNWQSVLDFNLVDVVGIDPYKFHTTDPSLQRMLTVPNYGTGGSNPSAMQKLVAWGKPIAMMEWGVVSRDVTSGAAISDAERAQWITDGYNWMKAWNANNAVDIEAAAYFHLNVSTGNSLLAGQALEAFSAAAANSRR